MVAGAGRVEKLYVAEGEHVAAGQKLFSLVSADRRARSKPKRNHLAGSRRGGKVLVSPGSRYGKGQALIRVDLTDRLEVRADVDEVDLGSLKVGDLVPVTLDMNPGNPLVATVTRISALGVSRQNAAYFTVRASLPAGSALLGASASLYLPKSKRTGGHDPWRSVLLKKKKQALWTRFGNRPRGMPRRWHAQNNRG